MLSLVQLKYLSRCEVSEACSIALYYLLFLVIACHGKLLVIAVDLILLLCFLYKPKCCNVLVV
jgi:membrane-anchored protein YejM (alkaline phosphatase superfamily)